MYDIIVIGAGAAGLAAARALREAGRPALVVEARSRIGGRIHTDHSHGPVELGAEFIHGHLAATWAEVRAARLRTAPWGPDRRFACGGAILPADHPAIVRTYALYERVTSYTGSEISAAELLARHAPPEDPAHAFVLRWLANVEGADPARLSALALSRERADSTNGEGNFHVLDGYDQVVAWMAAGLELRLASPVEGVAWRPGSVTITLATGERIAARQAIITVPLALLRAGRPGFEPPLPEAKQAAMEAIAVGHVTKLVLWFKQQLWPDFTVLSTDGRVATWWPVESAATPTLMGYTGGQQGLALAALGQEQAIAVGVAELSTLFGADMAAALLGGRLADWSRDPWSLGAYTYSPVGMGMARATLAAPVSETLFFAGEATLTNGHLATVHGAIESGQRAAAEALGSQVRLL
ncbi:MAG: NAD(P)/FAD-dependent oxidoreductase [Chloroflexi bacterium OHK40]